jgi:hypothetical protein
VARTLKDAAKGAEVEVEANAKNAAARRKRLGRIKGEDLEVCTVSRGIMDSIGSISIHSTCDASGDTVMRQDARCPTLQTDAAAGCWMR